MNKSSVVTDSVPGHVLLVRVVLYMLTELEVSADTAPPEVM
jgi:hypothetical protein